MAEANRLQAVLPDAQSAIGIAAGYPLRLRPSDRQLQGVPRGPRLPLALVNNITAVSNGIWLAGGTPGRQGLLGKLDPTNLVTSNVDVVGSECLTGFLNFDDVQFAVNAKGALFSRVEGSKWSEQQGHQGACNGILKVNNTLFVTIGVDGLIHCWDRRASKTGTLEGHAAGITAATITDDNLLLTVSSDRSLRIWDPARKRQRMFHKGFEHPLVDVHHAGTIVVAIDAVGQVFVLHDFDKPKKTEQAVGTPCCSWLINDGQLAFFIARRNGMIHRISPGV